MGSIIWDIVIQPLVYLIELVFSVGYLLTGSAGAAIVGVSLAVNLLCLPLYRMADAAQERQRAKQASMQRWVDHINKHFSGDERVMMLSYYYKEQHYRPAQALVGSLSLLLQIPFFMAAYSYLSGLSLLRGASFAFLPNLGVPDGLVALGGVSLNLMPVLMTALNCASTALYTRGLPLRDKLQAYGLAAVFLVLLYESPSGLVFYWTCNQLFSLGKNVFMKVLPEPRRWALLLVQACVVLAAGWVVASGHVATAKIAAGLLVALAAFEALWVRAYRRRDLPAGQPATADPARRRRTVLQFVAGGALLSVLVGALVPTALIADSPTEFMIGTTSPLQYVRHTLCVWGGVLLLWWGIYFFLSDEAARRRHVLVQWLLCGVCLIDYFAFGRNLGTITTTLVWDGSIHYGAAEQLANLAALLALAGALWVLWRWRQAVVLPATAVLALSLVALSVANVTTISTAVAEERATREASASDLVLPDGNPRQILHLSQAERNVVVVFLDRAISGYLPYIMAERPELEAQFDGFTYYPNTLSHGWFTNFGAPGLYGGYDYTPAEMNDRPEESLQAKHDEAMLLMPTLMSEAGMQTTVVDPPYAGSYALVPDLSIYDGLSNTEAVRIAGAYTQLVQDRLGMGAASDLERRFVYYAALRALPEFLQGVVYNDGDYLSVGVESYPKQKLMDELSVLELLPELTDTTSGRGGFVLLGNCATHEEDYLQLPDYEMTSQVNNSGLGDMSRFELDGCAARMNGDYQLMHYHVNAASLMRLGHWFDWMREQGVWDNTRVVIVSDHGRDLASFADWIFDDHLDLMKVNPLLMVKDFSATGFTVSDEFMTNADVPAVALAGIVDDPVNPFTGNPVDESDKFEHDQLVTLSHNYEVANFHGNTFETSDAPWYSVHDDIFDPDNWTRYDTFEQALEAVPQ